MNNSMHVSGLNPVSNIPEIDEKPDFLSWLIFKEIKNSVVKGILIKRDLESSTITFYDGPNPEDVEIYSQPQFEHKFNAVQGAIRQCETLGNVLDYIRTLGQSTVEGRLTPQREAWGYFIEMAKALGVDSFDDMKHYLGRQPDYMQHDFLAVLNRDDESGFVDHHGHRYKLEQKRSCVIF